LRVDRGSAVGEVQAVQVDVVRRDVQSERGHAGAMPSERDVTGGGVLGERDDDGVEPFDVADS
jgi:hypothetical protein